MGLDFVLFAEWKIKVFFEIRLPEQKWIELTGGAAFRVQRTSIEFVLVCQIQILNL